MEILNQKMAFITAIILIILIILVMLFFTRCRKDQTVHTHDPKNEEDKLETNREETSQNSSGGTHPNLTNNVDFEKEIERLINSISSNPATSLDSLINKIMEKINSSKGRSLPKKTRDNLISRIQAKKTKFLQAVQHPAPKPNKQPSEEIKPGTRIKPPKI